MLMAHVIPAGCQVQVETGCGRVLAAAGLGAGRVAAVAGLLVGRQAHRRLRRRNLRTLLTSESCDGFNQGSSDAEIEHRCAPQFKTRKMVQMENSKGAHYGIRKYFEMRFQVNLSEKLYPENSKITFVTESKGDGGCDVDRSITFRCWFKDNSIPPVVGCRLEDDERDDREVVLEPRARHPPCCDASECLFSRKPSRAAGEFLYQSGTLSRCNDRCTLSSCSLGTRSPTFCSSFSGGWNDKFMFVFFSNSSMQWTIMKALTINVRNSLEVVREFDAKKYLKSNLPNN
ncbi:hypothetical protein ALC57_00946 [Trachymyrmex cornetzi]|uniref:Uncharacterized protein n=1 Tax=Trachymyrmex cornetzi TaxID=471704 RepID=A0A195ENC1_9HYME|nr:hypothetical protein ALC57_00946 [Trachymyrmex cornetzi]